VQVVAEDPQYCHWVVQTAFTNPKADRDFLRFALYVQRARQQSNAEAASASGVSVDERGATLQVVLQPDPAAPGKSSSSRAAAGAKSRSAEARSAATGTTDGCAVGAAATAVPPSEAQLAPLAEDYAGGAPSDDVRLPAEVCGVAGCLACKSFVLTGAHASLPRPRVEELIAFFGGSIRKAVSGKTNFLVILGHKKANWHGDAGPVQSSKKYQEAQARGTAVLLGLEALLELITASGRSGDAEHGLEHTPLKKAPQLSCFNLRRRQVD